MRKVGAVLTAYTSRAREYSVGMSRVASESESEREVSEGRCRVGVASESESELEGSEARCRFAGRGGDEEDEEEEDVARPL